MHSFVTATIAAKGKHAHLRHYLVRNAESPNSHIRMLQSAVDDRCGAAHIERWLANLRFLAAIATTCASFAG
jgi:hypothetical protein